MPLDMNWLLLSIVISSIGAVFFLYGKQQSRLPHMVLGGLICLYPYFVRNLLGMLLIGIILGVAFYCVSRLDI